jgi:hypothetical protein
LLMLDLKNKEDLVLPLITESLILIKA